MNSEITRKELEKILEERIVCEIFDEVHYNAQRWNGGGALIHRVRAWGYMAEAGARNIRLGEVKSLTGKSTFEDWRNLDKEEYDSAINFLYSMAKSKIYVPC